MNKFLIILVLFSLNFIGQNTPVFYGMNPNGGENILGSIFSIISKDSIITENYSFVKTNEGAGIYNNSMCLYTNGKLYGTTDVGGKYNFGVLFEYDPVANIYSKKYDFDGGLNGRRSIGGLTLASNGKLYGTTSAGGTYSVGTLFEYDPINNLFQKKADFNNSLGRSPDFKLIEIGSNKLYGTTSQGGANSVGTIFEYNISTNLLSKKCDFLGGSNGKYPNGELAFVSNKIYGVAQGGLNNIGIIYEYDLQNDTLIKKVDFSAITHGSIPTGGLYLGSDGLLYGSTKQGGSNNKGTIYTYSNSSNLFQKKYDFSNEYAPTGLLIEPQAGKLYGVASGGNFGDGVIYEFDFYTNMYQKRFNFLTSTGYSPTVGMTKVNSKLYGLTFSGGLKSNGVIYEYDYISNLYSKKIDFGLNLYGEKVTNGLTIGPNGKLYGTTEEGGIYNCGVLFEYDPLTNNYTKKIDFETVGTGKNPFNVLTLASNNKLYGVTEYGGTNNSGVLFEYDVISNTLSKKIDFNTNTGFFVYGGLMEASNGLLYGTARIGGTYSKGVIFEYNPVNNDFLVVVNFDGSTLGELPKCKLTQAGNDKLYGVIQGGGIGGYGTIIEFDINTKTCVKKYDFTVQNRYTFSDGSLTYFNNKLYFLVIGSGIDAFGQIFEFDPNTNITTSKIDFAQMSGTYPLGSLIKASNNKLYGVTRQGGVFNQGVLFEYEPVANVYSKVIDFSWGNNSYAVKDLLEIICPIPSLSSTIKNNKCFNGSDGEILINSVAIPPISFLWNNGETTPSLDSLSVGTYSYLVQDACSNSVSSHITILEPDPVNINAQDSINICNGNSMVLNVNATGGVGNIILNWEPISQLGNNQSLSPNVTTVYTITGTDANGCVGTTTTQVVVIPNPTVSITGSTTICDGGSASLSSYGANTYTWSTNENVDTINVAPNTTTIYSVTGSDANNCVGTATAQVVVNPNPIINITDGIICEGMSYTMMPTGTGTYTYSSGSDIVSPTTTTDYTITGTDANGCIGTATTQVVVNSNPIVNISSTSSVCEGTSIDLSASGADMYIWNNGTITNSINVIPTTNTTYTVTGTDMNGCSSTKTVEVVVDNSCQDVWPGDANSDGAANNLDVLELGLHYAQTGVARITTSNTWQSYNSTKWLGNISNGRNLNHSDCNGDGTINNDDTLAIYNNYGLTHEFKPNNEQTINPDLTLVPDQVAVPVGTWGSSSVFLGDPTNQISNINGVAFTVDFDNTLIEPNSIWIEYPTSFINSVNDNLHFRKLDFANNKLYTATTHTLSNNVNGDGKIAVIHYQTKASLTDDAVLNLGISQAHKGDATGVVMPLTANTNTVMIVANTTGVSVNNQLSENRILIYPNPANETLNIKCEMLDGAWTPPSTSLRMTITNILGQKMQEVKITNQETIINLYNYRDGVYFVNIYNGKQLIYTKRIIKN